VAAGARFGAAPRTKGVTMPDRANIRRRTLAAAAVAAAALPLLAGDCGAIPAFARKYRMSCTTCHAPAPRLKPYGEDFAGNGYRLEGKEPARHTFETGDSLLTLVRELPLAIRVDAYASYASRGGEDQADLKTPYSIKIMSGGNIAKNIIYYIYFYMSERGEVAGVEDAFVGFNDLFGADLDLAIGQFQVSDPLFKRELRLTIEDYEIYRTRVGSAGTNLTYDRGIMVSYATPFGTDLVAEVVNGNGIGAAGNIFDDDDWKNVLVRGSHGVGPVRLGAFGYFCNAHAMSGGNYLSNEHRYWGVDGTVDAGASVQLNWQYLERTDDNPFFVPGGAERTKTRGGFLEAIWAVRGELGRSFVTFLYNHVDSDVDELYAGRPSLDYRAEALNYSYLLRRNFRISTELQYREVDDEWNVAAGFTAAF
jgi:hypothetical protein